VLAEPSRVEPRKDIFALLLIATLTFLAYSNSFHGEFQYDDQRLIRFNFALRDLSNWHAILRFEPFRPLTLLTYALNFQISKKDPFSYHIFNFSLHLISTFLFYAFLRRFSSKVSLCFFSSALFALHPLNTESVSYIASRPILLCAIFYWLALFCFDRYVRRSGLWNVIGFYVFLLLGLASKEDAALIPAAALLMNGILYGKKSVRQRLAFHISSLLFILFIATYRVYFNFSHSILNPYPVSVYLPTEAYVCLHYLGLALYPIPLNVDHYVTALDFLDWRFWVSTVVITGLISALLKMKRRYPFFAFWGFWFFLNSLASSSVFPLAEFMAEHRTYLSLYGFTVILGFLPLFTVSKDSDIAVPSKLISISLILLLLFYGFATWKRNLLWETRLTLWVDTVEKSPQKFRPHLNLGFVLSQMGAYDAAIQEYIIARRIDPRFPVVYAGLGFVYLQKGMMAEAESAFQNALKIDPNYFDAKTGLGIIHYRQEQYRTAISYFEQVYPYRKESPELIIMMSECYIESSMDKKASDILSEASRWYPDFASIEELLNAGKKGEALDQLRAKGKKFRLQ
jgi:tetratricopeptide (TPR) repeat protein